jgi:hypothetical protein
MMEKKLDYFMGGYSSFIFQLPEGLLIFPKDAA